MDPDNQAIRRVVCQFFFFSFFLAFLLFFFLSRTRNVVAVAASTTIVVCCWVPVTIFFAYRTTISYIVLAVLSSGVERIIVRYL